MKILSFIALMVISSSLYSQGVPFLKTKLEITVLNTTGNPEAGAEVKIYGNEDDYLADQNVIQGKKFTDSKGKILYKDLGEQAYYIHVEKGAADNFGESEKTIPLKSGAKNKVNIIITKGD
jgi:hypothetical protein